MPHRENKRIVIGDEARILILSGSRQTCDAVKETFGSMSGNVAIEKVWGDPRITHDGVTVAREIMLADSVENIGAVLMARASMKTNDTAGDGTSATVILGHTVHALGHRSIMSGRNAMMMKRGILRASLDVKAVIDGLAQEITKKTLVQVATISASGDAALGALIADTVQKVGNGVTIEEYPGLNVEQEIVEGFHFDKGFASPKLQLVMEIDDKGTDPVCVLVFEKPLSKVSDLHPILLKMVKAGRTKVLIVGAISGHPLNYSVDQVMNGNMEICIADSPIYGLQRIEFLLDVAAVTGAKVISGTIPTLADLGKADRSVATSKSTTILGGKGDPEQVASRIDEINEQLKTETNEVVRKQMEQRLAMLKGKIGIIRVGGATDVDMKETKDRVDDAVRSAQGAVETGYVAGGGTALLEASRVLYENMEDPVFFASGSNRKPRPLTPTGLVQHNMHPDEFEGYRIVAEALKAPFTQLMLNSGQPAEYNLKMAQKAGYGKGYNLENLTDEPIDLFKDGILDAAKVIRAEVENALSVAAELVTTNVAIVHESLAKVEEIEDVL